MDKNWSEMNKEMQALLSREATFREGVSKLLELRENRFFSPGGLTKPFTSRLSRREMNCPGMKSRRSQSSWM